MYQLMLVIIMGDMFLAHKAFDSLLLPFDVWRGSYVTASHFRYMTRRKITCFAVFECFVGIWPANNADLCASYVLATMCTRFGKGETHISVAVNLMSHDKHINFVPFDESFRLKEFQFVQHCDFSMYSRMIDSPAQQFVVLECKCNMVRNTTLVEKRFHYRHLLQYDTMFFGLKNSY